MGGLPARARRAVAFAVRHRSCASHVDPAFRHARAHRPRLSLAVAACRSPRPPAPEVRSPAATTSARTTSDTGLDCYLDAVVHLYTMCRHVKSIEIIEFGYEKAQEGVNGAKSEYCVDKQKINITRPYQAALREATPLAARPSSSLRALQQFWLDCDGQAASGRPAKPTTTTKTASRRSYDELSWKIDGGARRRSPPRRTARPPPPPRRRRSPSAEAKPKAPRSRTDRSWTSPRTPRPAPSRRDRRRPALDAIFREGGTLARALPGFRFRPQQLAMAQAIAQAIAERGQLVAEAGTGTGKTFAYLVPALLYGGKVIVSTGTKTLQDQLFERDLPLVRDALAVAGDRRAAQGPRQLRLPLPPRARGARGPAAVARRRAPPAEDRRVRARVRARRPRRARRRARERDDLAAGHVDARQLPRPELPASTPTASC